MPNRTIDAQVVRGELSLRCRKITAYVEQLRRREKRVKLIEGRLEIGWPLWSNDQPYRSRLTSVVDGVLLRIFHHYLLLRLCRHVTELDDLASKDSSQMFAALVTIEAGRDGHESIEMMASAPRHFSSGLMRRSWAPSLTDYARE
jgi:hypothetical protein